MSIFQPSVGGIAPPRIPGVVKGRPADPGPIPVDIPPTHLRGGRGVHTPPGPIPVDPPPGHPGPRFLGPPIPAPGSSSSSGPVNGLLASSAGVPVNGAVQLPASTPSTAVATATTALANVASTVQAAAAAAFSGPAPAGWHPAFGVTSVPDPHTIGAAWFVRNGWFDTLADQLNSRNWLRSQRGDGATPDWKPPAGFDIQGWYRSHDYNPLVQPLYKTGAEAQAAGFTSKYGAAPPFTLGAPGTASGLPVSTTGGPGTTTGGGAGSSGTDPLSSLLNGLTGNGAAPSGSLVPTGTAGGGKNKKAIAAAVAVLAGGAYLAVKKGLFV